MSQSQSLAFSGEATNLRCTTRSGEETLGLGEMVERYRTIEDERHREEILESILSVAYDRLLSIARSRIRSGGGVRKVV